MRPLKFDRIEIRKPRYDSHPEKSKTDNSKWRVGLFVIFKDYNGLEWDWMPTWKQIDKLNIDKRSIAIINSDIARNRQEKVQGVLQEVY